MRLRHVHGPMALCLASALALTISMGSPPPAAAQAVEPIRINITSDKARLLVVPRESFSKVIVSNPSIADVQVITPSQLLITGKATGVTSLILFYGQRAEFYDVAVNPTPLGRSGTPPPNAVTHGVLVQRSDKVSESLFLLDKDQLWIELGAARVQAEETTK